MKNRLILLIAALSLATGGCAALPLLSSLVSPRVSSVGGVVVLDGTKALLLAHNGFQAAEAAIAPLIRAHLLTAGQVDQVEKIANRAEVLFRGAGSAQSAAERAQQIIALTAQLNAVTASHK